MFFNQKFSLILTIYLIVVYFKSKEIPGDTVAYGDWYDLSVDECLEYIEVKENPIRIFDRIIKKY